MAGIGSSIIAGSVSIVGATTATIYNVNCAVAGNEYFQILANGTVRFSVRSRKNGKLQISFTSGETGINFFTIPAGCVWAEDGLSLTGRTLYFQSNIDNDVVEILQWT